jgi:hypothetical protein
MDKKRKMRKNNTIPKRFWCEDISQTLKEIRNSKKNGKIIEINGLQYEHIGDDMLYCFKSSSIKKLEK